MPTVDQMWEKKAYYTRTASDIARTLCLSGLALVWIFRTPTDSGSALAAPLLTAAALIVFALLLDLAQYLIGALMVDRVAKARERELQVSGAERSTEFLYPTSHPVVMNRLWALKIAVVTIAWIILLAYVTDMAVRGGLPRIDP